MKQYSFLLFFLSLTIGCSTSGLRAPAQTEPITLQLETVQQFLYAMDLEKVYINHEEYGAPGFFLAVPQVTTAIILDSSKEPPQLVEPKVDDLISYYFKGDTGLKIKSNPWDDLAPAEHATTGTPWGFYPCLQDEHAKIALIDAAAINKEAVSNAKLAPLTGIDTQIALAEYEDASDSKKKVILEKASLAKGKLLALKSGMRHVAGTRLGVYVDCSPADPEEAKKAMAKFRKDNDMSKRGMYFGKLKWNSLPFVVGAKNYEGYAVTAQAVWASGTIKEVDDPSGRKIKIVVDNKGKPVKADTIQFVNFGDFAWSKTDHGVVANANTLIKLYRDMGYQY